MEIKDDWKIEDGVSGLKIKVVLGKALNRLHIENLHASDGVVNNRDFFFTKDGKFDGTGSIQTDIDPAYEEAKSAAESRCETPK